MEIRRKAIWTAAVAIAIGTAACKSDSPSDPSQPPAATITISGNNVTPKNVTVPPGSQVLFVNNDTVSHNMNSDPHPEHNQCPEINQVGVLNVGQSRSTGNLNTVRVCGYHDHDRDTVQGLKGTIAIQ